jgi:hypothetical protein
MTAANITYGVASFAILFGLGWLAGLAVPLFPVAVVVGGVVALQDDNAE